MNSINLAQSKAKFIEQMRSSYPGLKNQPLEDVLSENLFSPFDIELPHSVLIQAKNIISTLFNMRQSPSYLEHYQNQIKDKNLRDPGNKSIVMSYDFHLDENQNLKLIEVNTNAGFMALGHELYKSKKIPLPVADFSLNEIADNVVEELNLQGKAPGSEFKIAIIDNKPQEQRLYGEFLLYNELFKARGWNSQILDFKDTFLNFRPDFIYNRHTDFYLNETAANELREKFLSREICLSPNPFEYLLIADKQRLIDWSQPHFFENQNLNIEQQGLLETAIPKSFDVTAKNSEEIWSQRKKLFLKPKNAFGSKQSYKGASISRKAFEELLQDETIAQEYVAAPEVKVDTPNGPQIFKYDLRCYAYQGRLQLVIARLYQGQVTNLRTPFGGFGCVIFK